MVKYGALTVLTFNKPKKICIVGTNLQPADANLVWFSE